MTTPVAAFDNHLADWKANQTQPWMRLRYELAQAYLARHMPASATRILDVGGGNGVESLPLAEAGHDVTILDYSTAMLDDARQSAQALGIADHVNLVHGSLDTLLAHVPAHSFDLVLCHNVLQYVDAPAKHVATIANCLAPNGMLSIINPNPAAEAMRLACQQYDLAGAAAALSASSQFAPTFGVSVHRYSELEVKDWLAKAGLSVVAEYGIRCVCDYLADNDRKYDETFFAQLRSLELAMGAQEPYIAIARFMHLIAWNKNTDSVIG